MVITLWKGSENRTFPTEAGNGTLIAKNVSLPEGNWTVKIVDSSGKGITYNTTRNLHVFPPVTPVPTWDGRPVPLQVTQKPAEYLFKTRPYPEDPKVTETPMKIYSNFGGTRSISTAPINIPFGYWDLVYTVDFKTNIANPASGDVFEFNKQYKEPLVTYEGEPVIYYPKNSAIPEMIATKEKVESDTVFSHSRDQVLVKTPSDERDANPPFETSVSGSSGPLVESVGYTKPDITIKIRNTDYNDSPVMEIRPDGGIDPLQWNEAKHKEEAEKILKQQGKQDLLDSARYQDEWEKSWERVKDPRPWTERIFGPGNYSFVIDTQSIDSYNIQIRVPNASFAMAENLTDDRYGIQKQNIMELLTGFTKSFNEKVDSGYFSLLSQYLAADQRKPDRYAAIYRELSQARASGYTIDDVVIDDILIQGTTATVRGELSVLYNGYMKKIPLDITLVYEDGGWKIQTVPDIR
jgi:hypothetical protein